MCDQPLLSTETDIVLSDGRIIRVTGLLAVKHKTDPDGVRKFVEEDLAAPDFREALERLAEARLYGLGTEDDLALDMVLVLMRKYGMKVPADYDPMDRSA